MLLPILSAAAVLLAAGYSKGKVNEGPVVAVTGVSLNKTVLTLAVGATETLEATVSPADATNKTITWSSPSRHR